MRIKQPLRPSTSGLNQIEQNSQPREPGQRKSLNLIPGPAIQPPSSRLLSPSNLLKLPTRNRREMKFCVLWKKRMKKREKLIYRNNRMTRPTEEGQPSLPELSINEMRLNQESLTTKKGALESLRVTTTCFTNLTPQPSTDAKASILGEPVLTNAFEHIRNRL